MASFDHVAWVAGDGFAPNIALTQKDVEDLHIALSGCASHGRTHAANKAIALITKLEPLFTAREKTFGADRNQDPWAGPGPGTVD